MQFSEIKSEVESVIASTQYTATNVETYINQGMLFVAGLIRIRALQATKKLSISSESTPLPTASGEAISDHKIYLVELDDGCNTKVAYCETYNEFAKKRRNGFDNGDPEYWYRQGSNLLVTPVPSSAVDVNIYYYRKPVEMSADTDTPDGLPEHLHSQILTNYACMQIFGLNNDVQRYSGHKNLLLEGVQELRAVEVPDESEVDFVTDEEDYIC